MFKCMKDFNYHASIRPVSMACMGIGVLGILSGFHLAAKGDVMALGILPSLGALIIGLRGFCPPRDRSPT